MSDKSKTVVDSMEETKERHKRYLRAINNPVRRRILRAMFEGNDDLLSISESTGMDMKTLNWHLSILIDGFCVEKISASSPEKYRLTKEAEVVDFLDK
ncbi:ArsR family transcriptional regulator [Candidatus Bathyarchaeota archaeon]|nr:ArsR family transcriptional regulator [Candidatus Bathyarchaeota archaeon]